MSEPLPADVHELLGFLEAAGVRFLVVGAHALAVHGASRYTGDFDILLWPEPSNAKRAMAALRAFGAPVDVHELTEADLATEGIVYQLGLPPRRIDLLTRISGVGFEEAWSGRVAANIDGRAVHVLGLSSLVKNKRATGRAKDLLDLELLREAGVELP